MPSESRCTPRIQPLDHSPTDTILSGIWQSLFNRSSKSRTRRASGIGSSTRFEPLEDRMVFASLAMFFDPVFVDTAAPSGEGAELAASLTSLGHSVHSFSGITAADFSSGLSGRQTLVFPEADRANLAGSLTSDAKAVIANFVQQGGGLVMAADSGGGGFQDRELLNSIFGFQLVDVGSPSTSSLMAAASGTRFAGGPATLPQLNQTSGFTNASLPAGAKSIYASNNNDAYVALLPAGTGEIAYLGWDWFGAAPAPGTQDGGWLDVLDRAVEQVSDRGDFNNDGFYSCGDANALVAAIASGSVDPQFDLTLDGDLSLADMDEWRAVAGAVNLPSGNPFLAGDANLDGFVDGTDFNRWNRQKFTFTPAWCSGDFNADGAIDAQDFNIWNMNKFMSSDGERGDHDRNELALVAVNATSQSTPWNSNSTNMSLRNSRGVRGVRSVRIG